MLTTILLIHLTVLLPLILLIGRVGRISFSLPTQIGYITSVPIQEPFKHTIHLNHLLPIKKSKVPITGEHENEKWQNAHESGRSKKDMSES